MLLLEEEKPDIAIINEIKMNETNVNSLYGLKNYLPYFKIRNSNKVGCIAIVAHARLKIEEIKIPNEIDCEAIRVNLKICNKLCNIFAYSNPPSTQICKPHLEFSRKNGEYLLVGDMNARIVPPDKK